MKNIIFFIISIFILNISFAQTPDTSWKKGGLISLNFSQTVLVNWAGGGANSLAFNGLLNPYYNYKSGTAEWDNSLLVAYGIVKTGAPFFNSNNAPFIKSDDRLEISSQYNYFFSKVWAASFLFDAKSQMAPGYLNPLEPSDSGEISRFLNPAYWTFSLGISYKPCDYFSVLISPATLKLISITDSIFRPLYIPSGSSNVYTQFGGLIDAKFKKDIITNVNLQSELSLFTDYLHTPQNVQVDWTVLLGMKINKYLAATLSTELKADNVTQVPLYDDNGLPEGIFGYRTQFKEVLGVGFSYKF